MQDRHVETVDARDRPRIRVHLGFVAFAGNISSEHQSAVIRLGLGWGRLFWRRCLLGRCLLCDTSRKEQRQRCEEDEGLHGGGGSIANDG